jgi:hypothetical protein
MRAHGNIFYGAVIFLLELVMYFYGLIFVLYTPCNDVASFYESSL